VPPADAHQQYRLRDPENSDGPAPDRVGGPAFEDDRGRADVLVERLLAGGFDGLDAIAENGGQDRHPFFWTPIHTNYNLPLALCAGFRLPRIGHRRHR
jgi:hypothetical protein